MSARRIAALALAAVGAAYAVDRLWPRGAPGAPGRTAPTEQQRVRAGSEDGAERAAPRSRGDRSAARDPAGHAGASDPARYAESAARDVAAGRSAPLAGVGSDTGGHDADGANPRTESDPEAAEAKRRELLAMSDSYRDTSLLIAIQQGGYMCTDLRDVQPAASGIAAWRVACEDELAYWVGVDRYGRIAVQPSPNIDTLAVPILPSAPSENAIPNGGELPRRIERLPYLPPIPSPDR